MEQTERRTDSRIDRSIAVPPIVGAGSKRLTTDSTVTEAQTPLVRFAVDLTLGLLWNCCI